MTFTGSESRRRSEQHSNAQNKESIENELDGTHTTKTKQIALHNRQLRVLMINET